MDTGFFPTDPVPRTQARCTDGRQLCREFEEKQVGEVDRYDWELFAAIAVAKVLELERRLGVEDRRVRSVLYRRSGNVIPMLRNRKAGARAELPPPA